MSDCLETEVGGNRKAPAIGADLQFGTGFALKKSRIS